MSAPRFGVRGQRTPLGDLLRGVLQAAASGSMGRLHALLSEPFGEAKSGLHALRIGFTGLAKLAEEEHAAERREQGWAPWPEILGQLVEEQGAPEDTMRNPEYPNLRMLQWDGEGEDGKPLRAVVELDGDDARVVKRSWVPVPGKLTKGQLEELQELAAEGLRIASALCGEELEKAKAELELVHRTQDLAGMRQLVAQIESAVESVGSNSEVPSGGS